ncbi:MAG TPA: hypothetical protein VF256_05170, partial [Streptosporangiaceae bacterium]
MTFEDVLTGWLPGQRWFAGKGAPIDHLAIVADTVLVDGDPGMRHLIVAVSQAGGTDRYQLLAGLRTTIPGRLEHAVIGPAGTPAPADQAWTAYDALHDPPLTRRLLRAMVGQETIGPLSFAAEPVRLGGEVAAGLGRRDGVAGVEIAHAGRGEQPAVGRRPQVGGEDGQDGGHPVQGGLHPAQRRRHVRGARPVQGARDLQVRVGARVRPPEHLEDGLLTKQHAGVALLGREHQAVEPGVDDGIRFGGEAQRPDRLLVRHGPQQPPCQRRVVQGVVGRQG